MARFIIEGGQPLKGTITPAGNKNEALAVLGATLLTDEEVVLSNLPDIGDVNTIMEVLRRLGVETRNLGPNEVAFRARSVKQPSLDKELARRVRGSVTLAGPMLARFGEVCLPQPGGDKIGRRRVDTHLLALSSLGAKIEVGDFYTMRADQGLRGQDILLDETSVTATESAVMAAALAKGRTVIRNAASEPHVQGVCRMVASMGAHIEGIGSNTLVIEGVDKLHGTRHRIGPDHIEVGSFIGMAAATNGEVLIKDAGPENLRMILLVFGRLGLRAEVRGQDVFIPPGQQLEVIEDAHGAIPKIDDAPWPGFPADLTSIALVVATQARGTVLIFEKMFESRLFFVDRLIGMGAKLVLCDPHRVVVVGPSRLHGRDMVSPDIRAGIALVIAALCAEGKSAIQNIEQIDRGYERIEQRLRALGASIERAE